MYKIFNYNKSSEKKINYKLYRNISIIFPAGLIFAVICACINLIVGSILFVILGLLYVLYSIITHILFKKYFNCNVYILNEKSKEFYKMGIFPRVTTFNPETDEKFLTDNYYANYIFNDLKKFLKLKLLRVLNYSVNELVEDTVVNYKFREVNIFMYLNTLVKLNNPNYVIKQLNNKKFDGIVFKITKIYSYDFNDDNNYCIVCDVIENNKKAEYKKVKLLINKLFEKDDTIKEFIVNNCENEVNGGI